MNAGHERRLPTPAEFIRPGAALAIVSAAMVSPAYLIEAVLLAWAATGTSNSVPL
jgi:hypothetical protein